MKSKKSLFIFGLLIFHLHCSNVEKNELYVVKEEKRLHNIAFKDYLYQHDVYLNDGLYIEKKPDSLSKYDRYNYSIDNQIYLDQKVFAYDYFYIKNQDTFLFEVKTVMGKNNYPDFEWSLVKKIKRKTDSTIVEIRLKPDFQNDFAQPHYEQTPIIYLGFRTQNSKKIN